MLAQDKMWEDITASICDDFVSIKTEPTHQQNRYQTNNNIEPNGGLQSAQPPLHHSFVRHASGIQSSSQSIYGNIMNSSFNNNVMSTNISSNMASVHHSNRVLLYLPPTPPNSEPGSPSTQQQQQRQQQQHSHTHHSQLPQTSHQQARRTPPPPYTICDNGPATGLHHQMPSMTQPMHLNDSRLSNSHSQQISQHSTPSTAPTIAQTRYNRRNNPELEKRRIHRCDYPG